MSRPRVRADALLVRRGLAASPAEAQALIMSGKVVSGDHRVDKPGDLLAADAPLTVPARARFVSRGGDKLDHAVEAFLPLGLVGFALSFYLTYQRNEPLQIPSRLPLPALALPSSKAPPFFEEGPPPAAPVPSSRSG